MSSATESFCPECGIEPPVAVRRDADRTFNNFGGQEVRNDAESDGSVCAGCQNDQHAMSSLDSWTESTALQSTFTVRGVNLTRTLIYPLMKAVIEELVREASSEKA